MTALAGWWARARTLEPARVRTIAASLFGVAAALGVTLPTGLDARVDAAIVAVLAVLPLVQGEATRARVVPTTKYLRAVDTARAAVAAELRPLGHVLDGSELIQPDTRGRHAAP